MIRRRDWLLGALAAATAAGGARAQDEGPVAPVRILLAGLDLVRKAGRSMPFQQRVASLTPVVQRAFALDTILRASIGPRFAAISPADQATLLEVFSQFTVASYVANFDMDSGEKFDVSPETRAVEADQVVSTRIVPRSGSSTKLDYVVRQNAGGPGSGWQIVDVLFDGSISQVAVQRSDFRSLLSGGSAKLLIDSLRKKADTLAAGGKA